MGIRYSGCFRLWVIRCLILKIVVIDLLKFLKILLSIQQMFSVNKSNYQRQNAKRLIIEYRWCQICCQAYHPVEAWSSDVDGRIYICRSSKFGNRVNL